MIRLNDRLSAMAAEVRPGQRVLDVGTDHGYLPLYLWERGIAPQVIMSDISSGSLQKAAENCRLYFPHESFDLRLGNGLEVIKPHEVDCVIIAGMGGILIRDILAQDRAKSLAFERLILQPRNNIGLLRYWLLNSGFHITREQLAKEGRYICEIITAEPGERAVSRNLGPERIEYQYPHTLIDFKNPLTEEYLRRKLAEEEHILAGLRQSSAPDREAIRSRQYRIDYLERLIKKL